MLGSERSSLTRAVDERPKLQCTAVPLLVVQWFRGEVHEKKTGVFPRNKSLKWARFWECDQPSCPAPFFILRDAIL